MKSVVVNDRMQSGYTYELSEPAGRNFHPDFAPELTQKQMHETFDGLPEDEIGKMLGGNAAEFYAVDTEKLAPLVARIGPEKRLFESAS